jgi:hypothetical protein
VVRRTGRKPRGCRRGNAASGRRGVPPGRPSGHRAVEGRIKQTEEENKVSILYWRDELKSIGPKSPQANFWLNRLQYQVDPKGGERLKWDEPLI